MPSVSPKADSIPRRQTRMRALMVDNVRFVTRTLSKAGVPRSDLDDEVQRTFIVAAGRLDDVRDGAERSFLFQVARNTASHARRTLARRREVASDQLPEWLEAHTTPEDLIARKQTRNLLDGILAGMDESLRAVFILFELEELDTVEIAQLLPIPRGTVASRLRRARIYLRTHVAAIELASELGVEGVGPVAGPVPLRREKSSSVFAHALLAVGVGTRASPATHARTRASLALG
jgi:RNA polymerase sigma-70 factor, ECF subfamily